MKNLIFILLLIRINPSYAQSANIPLYQWLDANQEKVIIAGHRGGYYPVYPENSLSLFKHIIGNVETFPIIFECDIREDKDGKLWLMHDATLERTTTGTGTIAVLSSKETAAVRLKNQNGTPTNEAIPSFEQLLNFIKDKSVYLMLDIKDDIMDKVADQIKAYGAENKCLILTFTPDNLRKALNLFQESLVSTLITSEKDWEAVSKLNASPNKLSAYVTQATDPALILKIKSSGVAVLSDPRELRSGVHKVHDADFYLKWQQQLQSNILVTDFPIEVSELLRKAIEQDSVIKKVLNLHHKKFRWMEQMHTDSLAMLLDDDVYYIHSNGWKESKEEVIKNIQSGKLRYINVDVQEADVRFKESTAVVTGKGIFNVSMEGKPLEINLYYTEVYAILPEGIKLLSRHACKI
jgi:glycerophosphoryl diester phosphodiesterase